MSETSVENYTFAKSDCVPLRRHMVFDSILKMKRIRHQSVSPFQFKEDHRGHILLIAIAGKEHLGYRTGGRALSYEPGLADFQVYLNDIFLRAIVLPCFVEDFSPSGPREWSMHSWIARSTWSAGLCLATWLRSDLSICTTSTVLPWCCFFTGVWTSRCATLLVCVP